MRIKRIFAANTREALRKVKEQHGPDAVVISSRNVDGGVEVISAVDYDERAVQAAARAQDPRAAEIPPLDGSPGPRPGEPDLPAAGGEPAGEAGEAGETEDEAGRAREAALARLRSLRAGGAVADDALPQREGGSASRGRPRIDSGAAERARANAAAHRSAGQERGAAAGGERREPRIDLRVGGADEDAELFDALSREHQEVERKRAEQPRRDPASRPERSQGGVGGGSAGQRHHGLGGAEHAAAIGAAAEAASSGAQSGAAAASGGGASRRRVEEEPAFQEMREEIRTLRSLFENQLSLLEWNRMGHRHPARAAVIKRLTDLGMGTEVSRKLADHIGGDENPDTAFRKALALIARHLPIAGDQIVDRGGVYALVGPTGVGKTTTVAKLAARYALRHGREQVALVSTDNYRVGAQDQLLTYARILDVPVYTATNRHELRTIVDDLMDRGLVLIDTVGMSQRDVRLAEQFKTLGSAEGLVKTYLVLSAATQMATLTESVSAFAGAEPVGCIFTKVDEASSLGGAMTCALRTKLPIAYLAVGQRVPEDLQAARGDTLVHRACALLDEHVQEADEEALALALGGGGACS
ncbi:flagellar biosynthesis protein FlhF [Halorhodospira halophila]|uniref:Flagellar biosynthesis protein FlhF n=1 Tax=Halorhodospira halophila (strain DSM 244 / SL1) TaxID=349124 RepID=A1WUA5_HALHL|nr:flagellar biosynthesis protein FlhF [Halorhodospira halophila]ABM61267.1 GTP-binding signal recognition particle SRP54, G- domain [Halorhodospira halophila SL1]MBK1729152.1 flagellar biosynthesis protein FlhF [Halorhodospira halophila]